MSAARREWLLPALLAVLPALAYAPAWWDGRLLGPGDGFALHYPLKVAVWQAYRRGELPAWNPAIFLGTPLLASYRPGAFFPLVVALAPLPSFVAFQALVLVSLAAAGALTFAYARRLGAHPVGAYFAGLSFALGPYLVGHLDDTATIVAAPLLPLTLLAAEALAEARRTRAVVALAVAVALLLLAGSPEAARAGLALLAGRVLVAALAGGVARAALLRAFALAVGAGSLLSAPQLVPALLAAHEAGRPVSGLAATREGMLPGATGLVLRYVSHTPALALALAALPLFARSMPIVVLFASLVVSLALQWGRGPLSAPGALSLAFDFTLCALSGLSLSEQWRHRREPLGHRSRAWFLVFTLASAAALSVAAASLGPLPEVLAGAVGVLALSLILYFSLAASPDTVKAGVWLLPLTVSFLLQPHGRRVWQDAPHAADLSRGTGTRQALDRLMGEGRAERTLVLVSEWPRGQETDLAYGSLAALGGRRSANGYDPLVPMRTRAALGGMGVGGTVPESFLHTDPARLEMLGIRWVEVPLDALVVSASPGPPELKVELEAGRPRFFPLPIRPATEVRLVTWMAEAVEVPQDAVVAWVQARLASGRGFDLPLRAGVDTAEWAHERPDVALRVAHRLPPDALPWLGPEGRFTGYHYRATLRLPGRYYLDGLRLERVAGPGRLMLSRLAVFDAVSERLTPVSSASVYVSDGARLRELASTPLRRLFELPGALPARVVEKLRVMPSEEAVVRALDLLPQIGLDPRREALVSAEHYREVTLPRGARSSRAEPARVKPGQLEVRAEGPGLLVVSEAWDQGWRAEVDGRDAAVHRVNHAQIGVVLPEGMHHVSLHYRPRGLTAGLLLAGVGAGALGFAAWRARPAAVWTGDTRRARVPVPRTAGAQEKR